jgi:hypothetical protein
MWKTTRKGLGVFPQGDRRQNLLYLGEQKMALGKKELATKPLGRPVAQAVEKHVSPEGRGTQSRRSLVRQRTLTE